MTETEYVEGPNLIRNVVREVLDLSVLRSNHYEVDELAGELSAAVSALLQENLKVMYDIWMAQVVPDIDAARVIASDDSGASTNELVDAHLVMARITGSQAMFLSITKMLAALGGRYDASYVTAAAAESETA